MEEETSLDTESASGEIRRRSRRRKNTFTMLREWVSGLWLSFTSAFTSGRRRQPKPASPDSFRDSSSSRRKSKGRSGKISITRPIIEKELADFRSKRNYRSHLLVLGLSGAGKSRLIKQLVRQELQKAPQGIQFFTELETENMTIIEGPGLSTGAGFETDADTIATIKQYLEQKLPIQIPNAVLIVARFDDNRFEGEASDFSRMLNGIKCLRKYLTDTCLTNVILVLTFKNVEEDDEESNQFKVSRFRVAFDAIFPESNRVRMVIIGKNNDISDLVTELSGVANERQDDHFQEALELFQSSDYIRSYPVALTPAGEFTPPQNEIYKIMEQLNKNLGPSDSDSDSEADSGSNQKLLPVMIPYNQVFLSDPNTVAQTWLRKGTLIKMANESDLEIESIRVGDKLLDYKLKSDVVDLVQTTTLRKWREGQRAAESVSARKPIMALIHCSFLEHSIDSDGRVLQYNRGRIRMMPYVEPIDPVSDDEIMFCIKLNSLDGTFIGDSCVFKHRIPPYPESTRL